MEGIYITETTRGIDRAHYGFVVYRDRGACAISKFSACTMPFIREHAKARGLDNPKVYFTIETIDSIED